jgi:hypothetical protein
MRFTFVPQFFMVVSNKTRGLLVSSSTLKPQQHWKYLKISFHNMIFPKIRHQISVCRRRFMCCLSRFSHSLLNILK